MVDDNVAFSIECTKHQTHPIVYKPVAFSYASIIGEFGWNDAGGFIMYHFTLPVANVFEFVFVAVNRRKNECWFVKSDSLIFIIVRFIVQSIID